MPPSLLSDLAAAGKALPPDIAQLLAEISALVSALPADGNLDALKKRGAWSGCPLLPNAATNPYYVRLPATIDITDLNRRQLEGDLSHHLITTTADAFGNAVITIPPLPKR